MIFRSVLETSAFASKGQIPVQKELRSCKWPVKIWVKIILIRQIFLSPVTPSPHLYNRVTTSQGAWDQKLIYNGHEHNVFWGFRRVTQGVPAVWKTTGVMIPKDGLYRARPDLTFHPANIIESELQPAMHTKHSFIVVNSKKKKCCFYAKRMPL